MWNNSNYERDHERDGVILITPICLGVIDVTSIMFVRDRVHINLFGRDQGHINYAWVWSRSKSRFMLFYFVSTMICKRKKIAETDKNRGRFGSRPYVMTGFLKLRNSDPLTICKREVSKNPIIFVGVRIATLRDNGVWISTWNLGIQSIFNSSYNLYLTFK